MSSGKCGISTQTMITCHEVRNTGITFRNSSVCESMPVASLLSALVTGTVVSLLLFRIDDVMSDSKRFLVGMVDAAEVIVLANSHRRRP